MNEKDIRRIVDLHYKWLEGKPEGQRADLSEKNLELANLSGVNLTSAILFETNLELADLTGTILIDADMRFANLKYALLKGARMAKAHLEYADMTHAQMEGVKAYDAKMEEAILQEAKMHGAKLAKANMTNAKMQEAILQNADMRGCELPEAILEDADLRDAVLKDSDLRFTKFGRALLDRADLINCTMFETNFTGARLIRADLRNTDDSGGILNCDFSNAKMKRAILINANCKGSSFTDADMTGVNFAGANLEDTEFTGAVIRDAIGLEDAYNLEESLKQELDIETEQRKLYGKKRQAVEALYSISEPVKLSAFKRQHPKAFDIMKQDLQGLPGGMLTPEIAQRIIEQYGMSWAVTYGTWSSTNQRVSPVPNTVIQLNIEPEAIFPENEEARKLLYKIAEESQTSGHPVHKGFGLFTIGWIRCTFFDVDPESRHLRSSCILVEEIQSDFSTAKQHLINKEAETVLDTIEVYSKRFYEDALGLVFDIAEENGYVVEMLTYETKRECCWVEHMVRDEQGGIVKDEDGRPVWKKVYPPMWIYKKLPKMMGMEKVDEPYSLPYGLDEVWRYTPKFKKNPCMADELILPIRWSAG